MTKPLEGGYEAHIVDGFIRAHSELREEDGSLRTLNGIRITDGHRQTIERWRRIEVVPLSKVDRMLHAYGLMTYELEDWARDAHGRNGFIEPVYQRQPATR